ncbi:hypothetical protein [Allonocardiopsis opalescens]|uniref:Uncharacterized protein n=1 Tax=Allonocardiopsis opalescens TaxID=1144618 RepID=A0A2T0PVK0_9ACTN|nr:hypothetical protein [Allonocardiopsis opalescens]PRX95565.1 hypothetical protein CLV72_109174 [Allonocardiopsis opalescens]
MTFQNAAFVDGGPINGILLRRQYQSATRGAEGIIEPGDLQVLALEVPGAGFRVTDGAAAILGRLSAWEGSYYGLNIGDHEVTGVAGTGSGGGRSDMVVARVAANPADPIEVHIIQGVAADAQEVPASYLAANSAIPLARIDWPASTATITQGMITDLRRMLAPRTASLTRIQRGMTPIDYAGDVTAAFENWPNSPWSLAGARVPIPAWATQAQIRATWGQTLLGPTGGTGGGNDARGQVRVRFYNGSDELLTQATAYNVNQTSPTNGYRTTLFFADTIDIPAVFRGVSAALAMQARGTAGFDGRLGFDEWAVGAVEITFNEVPVLDLA